MFDILILTQFEPDQEIVFKSPMPSSKSPVFSAGIKSISQLTSAEAVKTTLEVVIDLSVRQKLCCIKNIFYTI